jgi:hypothetical protein
MQTEIAEKKEVCIIPVFHRQGARRAIEGWLASSSPASDQGASHY